MRFSFGYSFFGETKKSTSPSKGERRAVVYLGTKGKGDRYTRRTRRYAPERLLVTCNCG